MAIGFLCFRCLPEQVSESLPIFLCDGRIEFVLEIVVMVS